MAMEDALVLAEVLRSVASVDDALDVFVNRRRPRVDWVQRQSRAVADMLGRPSAIRNGVLRERGAALLQDRFRPLIPAP